MKPSPFNIILFAATIAWPAILFDYLTIPDWVYFAQIPFTSLLFTRVCTTTSNDFFGPLTRSYVDGEKKKINWFWIWWPLCMAISSGIVSWLINTK